MGGSFQGADGAPVGSGHPTGVSGTNFTAQGGISGLFDDPGSIFFLVGVFLTDSVPTAPAPPPLMNFSGHENFTELSPAIAQTFFIGDGLTETGTGQPQKFHIPPTATRLFLGFADGNDFRGNPMFYQDNSGALTVHYNISSGCQVNPNISFFYQSDAAPLVPQPYFGGRHIAGCVTRNFGCALLTSSNMLRSFDNQFLSSDFPSSLDGNLIANNGYDAACGLFFDRIPQATGYFTQIVGGGAVADIDSYLDQHFCQEGDRAILKLNEYVNGSFHGPHFLLVTGKDGTDWNVFDPGWKPQNVSPVGANSSLQGHYTGFTTFSGSQATFRQFFLDEVRLFATTAIATPGSLSITALSPIELLVTDSGGRRLGSQGGGEIFEIPKGSYFRDFPLAEDDGTGTGPGDPSGIKTAYIALPHDGTYRIDAAGTGLGTYTINFRGTASTGAAQEFTAAGVTDVGSTSTFQVTYSSAAGSVLTASRLATFTGTLSDINNSLHLGLIDNRVIANSLSEKIQAVQRATGVARSNILNAFKNEVNAQAGKHITGVAVPLLLQDADSLVNSSP